MDEEEETALRVRLARAEIDHEDLAHAIDALEKVKAEQLRIQRFKKKKLALKDEISRLRDLLTPDAIA